MHDERQVCLTAFASFGLPYVPHTGRNLYDSLILHLPLERGVRLVLDCQGLLGCARISGKHVVGWIVLDGFGLGWSRIGRFY